MELSELFWKKIRFILLFVFSVCVLFIIQTKLMFKIPAIESKELLVNIQTAEEILEQQNRYVYKVRELHDTIKNLDFDISQVQKLNEVKRDINLLQNIYKKNNMNNKYIFGVQASKILRIYFNSRESLSKEIKNNQILEKNLNECKANI